MRYAFIDDLITHPPVEFATLSFTIEEYCFHLKVSRSGFYKWRSRQATTATEESSDTKPPSDSKRPSDALVLSMARMYIKNTPRNIPGYRKVHAYLRNNGIRISTKRLIRLLRENGICGTQKRRYVVTTDSSQTVRPFDNLLKRAFNPGTLDRYWCGDITYIRTNEGWIYAASVIDLGSRRALGLAIGPNMEASLVVAALEMAVQASNPKPGVIFHSDQGSQYNSQLFRNCLSKYQMLGSMSARGVCWDNAAAESFWSIMKREVNGKAGFETRQAAAKAICDWVTFYNDRRPHGAIDNMAPVDYELSLARNQAERKRIEGRTFKVASFVKA